MQGRVPRHVAVTNLSRRAQDRPILKTDFLGPGTPLSMSGAAGWPSPHVYKVSRWPRAPLWSMQTSARRAGPAGQDAPSPQPHSAPLLNHPFQLDLRPQVEKRVWS